MSFTREGEVTEVPAAVDHQREGSHHQVVTSDCEAMARYLSEVGISGVEENSMSINEIAVEILRSERHNS